ncbi:hypothetical protein SDC9_203111 [bioreactor metagenome]|uniref:Uncharacterized protein n=1 Tax=bioreactor metagenome TaxID=1076179 RepID=A0A645IYA7_9ZZZZ
MGKITVVRDNYQSHRILIQPAGGKKPLPLKLRLKQVHYRPRPGIARHAEKTGRFIEHQIKVAAVIESAAADHKGTRLRLQF